MEKDTDDIYEDLEETILLSNSEEAFFDDEDVLIQDIIPGQTEQREKRTPTQKNLQPKVIEQKSVPLIDIDQSNKNSLINLLGSIQLIGKKPFWKFFGLSVTVCSLIIFSTTLQSGQFIKEDIKTFYQTGFEALKDTKSALLKMNITEARSNLDSAKTAFNLANQHIQSTIPGGAIIHSSPSKTGALLKSIGEETTSIIEQGILLIEEIHKGTPLTSLDQHILDLHQRLQVIENDIKQINPLTLPEDVRTKLLEIREFIPKLTSISTTITDHLPNILKALGDREPVTYLVLLQNTAEARATGGFIGAVGLITFNDGKITSLEVKDTYNIDERIYKRPEAPAFLQSFAKEIALRDSNHNPNFEETSKLARTLLEQSYGPSIDGVIAIDDKILEGLLEISGPLILEDFDNLVLEKDHAFIALEYLIETNKDHPNTPKQALIDATDQLFPILSSGKYTSEMIQLLTTLIQEKRLQLYFHDEKLNQLTTSMGLGNSFPPPKQQQDALAIIHTSVSGNKSDYFIDTQYFHHSKVSSLGEITNTLKITRTHNFDPDVVSYLSKTFDDFHLSQLKSDGALLSILGAGPNKDLVRVYVPRGSTLLEISGVSFNEVQTYEEDGYTIFNFLQSTARNTSSSVTLKYKLPFQFPQDQAELYKLHVYKQPGQNPTTFQKTFKQPPHIKLPEPTIPANSPFIHDLTFAQIVVL